MKCKNSRLNNWTHKLKDVVPLPLKCTTARKYLMRNDVTGQNRPYTNDLWNVFTEFEELKDNNFFSLPEKMCSKKTFFQSGGISWWNIVTWHVCTYAPAFILPSHSWLKTSLVAQKNRMTCAFTCGLVYERWPQAGRVGPICEQLQECEEWLSTPAPYAHMLPRLRWSCRYEWEVWDFEVCAGKCSTHRMHSRHRVKIEKGSSEEMALNSKSTGLFRELSPFSFKN